MTYAKIWETPVGKDCISLDTMLCRWLGERLSHLGEHTNGHPAHIPYDQWKHELRTAGESLTRWGVRDEWVMNASLEDEHAAYKAAQDAMRWVADNLGWLWD